MPEPSRIIVLEPASTRSMLDWTPGLLKAARANADAGVLAFAADFCESAMADDRVLAALATRTNGLVALPLTFEAARGKKRLVKALEAGEDWWSAYPSTALAQLLRWGIVLGVGLAQHVWTDRGATINRLVPKLQVWNPRHLRWDWPTRRWMLRVDGGNEIEITPGDGTWVLFTPYGDNRPWAHGAWRAIAAWHLLKQYAISDWARYSERHGQGTTVVESDEKTTKERRKELAEHLYQLGRESVVVLPAGFKYELVEAVANTWETFQAQKNAADLGMAVAILGQNLSTEVTGPVSTGATLHGRVLQTYIDFDAETLTSCVHDQSLVWWAEFNFGSRDDAPWPVYDTKPPEDRKASADVAKTRAEAGKTLAGIGIFTVNEVRLATGHEPRKDGAGGDELVKVTPTAPAKGADDEEEDDEKAKAVWAPPAPFGTLPGREWALRKLARDLERSLNHTVGELKKADGAEPLRLEAELRVLADVAHTLAEDDGSPPSVEWRKAGKLLATELLARERQIVTHARSYGPALVDAAARFDALLEAAPVRLRSGRSVPASSGIVQGQLYADRVADHARERAAKVLDEDLVAVLEAVDGGASYDDIRQRLVKTFKGMSPDELARLTEAAITMAELGGRHATNEDL